MRQTNVIVLASNNKGKIEEYRELYKEFPELQFTALADLVFNAHMLEKVEIGKTYYENAFAKCKYGHYSAKYPTLSDDSGLEVDALQGGPGVNSANFGGVTKLLEALRGVPKDKRTARYVCTIVFMIEGIEIVATEKLEGTILDVPSGTGGFGFDPVFVPEGSEKSLGKMSMAEKNAISHRAKAFRSIMSQIKQKQLKLVRP